MFVHTDSAKESPSVKCMVIHGILVAKVAVRVLVTLHQRKVQLKEFNRECQRKVQLKAEDKQIA